jgi:hypothetical protein
MTQKLSILELSVFQEEIISYPRSHRYKLESGFCLHLITQRKKEKVCCSGEKQMARMAFLGESQCEALLPGLQGRCYLAHQYHLGPLLPDGYLFLIS